MIRHHLCLLVLLAILSVPAMGAPAPGQSLSFDMGPTNSPVAPGYLSVTPSTVYSDQQGYGWDRPAQSSFNDSRPVPEKFRSTHPFHVGPVTDPVLRDGIEDDQTLTFICDVPPGRYWVSAVVGRYTQGRHDMMVSLNGQLVATNIDAWGHVWGSQGGTPMKSFAVLASPSNGQFRFTFNYTHPTSDRWREYSYNRPEDGRLWYLGPNKNSVLAIRIRPYVPPLVTLKGNRLEGELPAGALQTARDLFHSGEVTNALSVIEHYRAADLPETVLQASVLDALTGSLTLDDRKREIALMKLSEDLWQRIRRQAQAQGNTNLVCLAESRHESAQRYRLALEYLAMLSYATANQKTGLNCYDRYWTAYELCNPFTPEDPLYFKSHLVRGRVANWTGREGHWRNCYDLSAAHFAVLQSAYPDHPVVRLYTGQRVAARHAFTLPANNAPEWARLQYEALKRYLGLIHYWVEHRQAENGELGGNWGDDVEILRGWAPAVLAVNDPVALRGIRKMAEGVWHSGEVENGFSRTISDVEHAAELVSDTQPIMCAVDYGNPVYLERCMASMRCFRDVWTATNAYGHRHFKSHFYSASAVSTNGAHAADVALNGRAANPGLWLLWYANHPQVRQLLGEWCRAWIADAFRAEAGKPAGFVPGSVRFHDDRLGGFAEHWWQTRGYFSDFESVGYTATLYHQMLGLYAVTRDDTFMSALQATLAAVEQEHRQPSAEAPMGSAAWAARICDSPDIADVMAKWRLLTGATDHDAFLARRGSAYTRYLITGDLQGLNTELRNIIEALSYNIQLSTTEVLFTDRVSLPGSDILFEMMSGSAGEPSYYPVHAVTWENTQNALSALVEQQSDRELVCQVYSWSATPLKVTLRPWRLIPGKYELICEPLSALAHQPVAPQFLQLAERGQPFSCTLPPHEAQRLRFRLIQTVPDPIDPRPDLALGPDAIEMTKSAQVGKPLSLKIRVHNLGTAAATGVKAILWDGDERIHELALPVIEAPLDLFPRQASGNVNWTPVSGGARTLRLRVECAESSRELVQRNNTREMRVDVR